MEEKRGRLGKDAPGAIIPAAPALSEMDEGYSSFVERLKQTIRTTRVSVALQANARLIMMYWQIGSMILKAQEQQGWGARVIDRISLDLKKSFPDMKGFSSTNLKYMRQFALAWPDFSIGQQPVDQLPWGSNLVLLHKLDNAEDRLWYAQKAIDEGWSRNVLSMQIESGLKLRSGKAVSNFKGTLPASDSDLAIQVFKDPYLFDFLGTDIPRRELEIEKKLTEHIQDFLLELGRGFAFVGRQVELELAGDMFRIDMLFYHLKLRCYVVIELKAGKFEPGYISQLNLYRNVVDDVLRHESDGKTIGLLLVKEKNDTVVRYALEGFENPIGVAGWQKRFEESLPEGLEDSLPTVEEIEREMENSCGLDRGE